MKRKFIDEISIAEMQKMREAGMTNQDIANALDVNYQTVYKYIGQQPSGMRKRYARIGAQVKANEEEAACLEVTSKVVELKSGIAEYTIYANNIKVKKGSQQYAAILIEKNEIDTFISELKAIKRHIEKENKGGEMW